MPIDYHSHPFGLLTYAGASKKWVRGPSGLLIESDPALTLPYEWGVNEFVNPDSPETQMISVDDESSYTVVVEGSGSVTLSGAAAGTVAAGQVRTFKMDGTSLTVTVNGSPTFVHVREALGIRVEEQRTNLVPNVTNLNTSSWISPTTSHVTVTQVDSELPFSDEIPVFSIVPNTDNDIHRIGDFSNNNFSTAFTLSYFVKANGYSQVALRESRTTGSGCVFNLDTETAETPYSNGAWTVSNPVIEPWINGWYRIAITLTAATDTGCRLGIYVLDGSYVSGDAETVKFAGDGTKGVLAALPQMEPGASMTSPIVTAGSTVTRAADVIGPALSAFPWNGGVGTYEVDGVSEAPTNNGTILTLAPRSGETHIRTVKWVPSP